MKRGWQLIAVSATLAASTASAQTESDLLRFEWITGVYQQGDMAGASFEFDLTQFGGAQITRDGGTLDTDPAFWFGVRTHYRLNNRWSVNASWMHAQSRYRVEFPARASDPGNFDLEGLILGVFDSGPFGQEHPFGSAVSNARIDMYMTGVRYEIPTFGGWAFPYFNVGTGLYQQRSDDAVFRMDFEGDPHPIFEPAVAAGQDIVQGLGVSSFHIDATDWLVTAGAGLRVSLSQRWGATLEVEDFMQLGADYSDIDEASTPSVLDLDPNAPPPPGGLRLFSTTFNGKTGLIHSYGVRLALNYAFWPASRPR